MLLQTAKLQQQIGKLQKKKKKNQPKNIPLTDVARCLLLLTLNNAWDDEEGAR